MSADPGDWSFTGATAPVPQIAARQRGWKQSSGSSGCLAASVATLLGWQAPLARAAMGPEVSLASATRVVQLWDPHYTLTLLSPQTPFTDAWPTTGKAVGLYRDGARPRAEDGRFQAHTVHAVVLDAESGDLYHDPHEAPHTDPGPWLGFLIVTLVGSVPAAATFPLEA